MNKWHLQVILLICWVVGASESHCYRAWKKCFFLMLLLFCCVWFYYKIERRLRLTWVACIPCSRGRHLPSERPLPCPQLTVTSLNMKEKSQIFIGTISLEQCGMEKCVTGDVKHLSVYLVWQSPQVWGVLVSTGNSESSSSFITFSCLASQTHILCLKLS